MMMETEETLNHNTLRRREGTTSFATMASHVDGVGATAQTFRPNVPTHEKLIDVLSTERHAHNHSLTPSITKSVRKTFQASMWLCRDHPLSIETFLPLL